MGIWYTTPMSIYFISDLHLQLSAPKILTTFSHFMANEAKQAQALYILGDLFEAWVGDDDPSKLATSVKASLKNLTQAGVPVYFMRGNRDVAIGERFSQETGVVLLDDPYVADIYNVPVLLMHGDLLCIDDVKYQAFRRKVYEPAFRKRFLSLPLFIRRLIATWARYKSKQHTRATNLQIQDVDMGAVEKVMREHQVQHLIHGHTHRPAIHNMILDGQKAQRIVLPAWHTEGHVLKILPTWEIIQTQW